MTMTADSQDTLKDGRVVAIAGPVVDVEFPPDCLPEINSLLEMDIVLEGETITVAAEVTPAEFRFSLNNRIEAILVFLFRFFGNFGMSHDESADS